MVDRVLYEQVERELGAAAMSSLAARKLVCDVTVSGASGRLDVDHLRGALVGLAFGDALAEWAQRARAAGRTLGEREVREFIELHDGLPIDRRTRLGFTDPVSALSQLMVLSAEAWLGSGWQAPAALADELVRRVPTMRLPGDATRRAVERRAAGRAWFEAAGDSFGDAQLPRAVAVGLVHAGQHGSLGLAASLDACVTHASQRAVAASATLASIVAALACQLPWPVFNWDGVTKPVVESAPDAVRSLCLAALAEPAPTNREVPPFAIEVLAAALRFAASSIEPTQALVDAVVHGGGERTVPAITGALVGAAYGASGLPPRARYVEGVAGYEALGDRIAAADQTAQAAHAPPAAATVSAPAGEEGGNPHIWFLLDRSGSMGSIEAYVVDGFEQFFASQREQSGAADVTIVQFDTAEPHDVIVDARPIGEVPSIRGRFRPRGGTPLYDAIGALLDRAEAAGGVAADQLVVIMTDGGENASRRWSQRELFERIGSLREQGWIFVFLGANQDSYLAGAQLDIGAGNVSNFAPSAAGVQATYEGLSRSVGTWRSRSRSERQRERDDFWGGVKEAEEVGR